ncbi:RNA polymerase subunit sigma-24 [Thioalkalivibrio denitrificans]|uniref:RNA polymerase subunit sigma-24 n=1 Tax=Thioalkalivibrio denitrificans TaxID=108003 RepID=A0A1V3NFV4_9GAMM|nr:sigma-70 family RNA polymerase sigma factor [Thioalkalivibrio denitrificans]OOG23987.1 RNA polymerase subunit sigma-24 [Thioalkalivibrio denitrificans]
MTDTSPPDLARLLSECALGNKGAFERLYRATSPKLFAIAVRILGSEAQAEECLQDAYVKIWHRAGDYRPHLASPQTWLVTIVRNGALDTLRRNRRQVTLQDPAHLEFLMDEWSTAPGPEGLDNDSDRLRDCLGQLGEDQRRCLEIAYFQGLSHAEVAQVTGTALGTVKTWIRRGLEQLRKCLDV